MGIGLKRGIRRIRRCSFLELSETKMIQKCKFQKRNDPPICVFSFLELTFFDLFLKQIGGSIWCFVLALCVTVTTRWIITCLHGWFGKSWIILLGNGGGRFMG